MLDQQSVCVVAGLEGDQPSLPLGSLWGRKQHAERARSVVMLFWDEYYSGTMLSENHTKSWLEGQAGGLCKATNNIGNNIATEKVLTLVYKRFTSIWLLTAGVSSFNVFTIDLITCWSHLHQSQRNMKCISCSASGVWVRASILCDPNNLWAFLARCFFEIGSSMNLVFLRGTRSILIGSHIAPGTFS